VRFVKILRIAGAILFAIGFVLIFVLFYEELLTFFNYYYSHKVNFELLVLIGFSTFIAGSALLIHE